MTLFGQCVRGLISGGPPNYSQKISDDIHFGQKSVLNTCPTFSAPEIFNTTVYEIKMSEYYPFECHFARIVSSPVSTSFALD